MTTVFKGSTNYFQDLIRSSVPIKPTSRNFDFGGLRSGQFSDQTIIRPWENVQTLFVPKVGERSS